MTATARSRGSWALRIALFAVILGVGETAGERGPLLAGDSSEPPAGGSIAERIRDAGHSRPSWWGDVPLRYPDSLDLAWPKPSGPWDTRKNVGQYMWSIINENPPRWREGTKFMHYVLAFNRKRPVAHRRAIEQLGHCYHDLLGDWARAAYWLEKIEPRNTYQVIALAHCYWELGAKELATRELEKIRTDRTRYGSAIKLWSEMGELDRALRLARASLGRGRKDAVFMGAGDACRRHGRYEEALGWYEKVLALPRPRKKDEIFERNRARARARMEQVRVYDTLDLSKIADGAYRGSSLSYNGDLSVEVRVAAARIESVEVTGHSDKQYYSALQDMPAKIVVRQSLKDLDATTGATITAEAIVHATARALLGR